jgi:hypothetical protein
MNEAQAIEFLGHAIREGLGWIFTAIIVSAFLRAIFNN